MEIPSFHHLYKWTGISAPLLFSAYFAEITYCPSKVHLDLSSGFSVTRTSIHQLPPLSVGSFSSAYIYSSFLLSFKIILFWFCIILQLYPMSLLLFFKSNILKVVLTCSLHLTSNSVFPKNVSCMHVSKWYILIESNNLLRNFKTESKSLVIFPFSPSFLPWRQLLKSFSELPWNSLETIGILLFLVFMFYTISLILSLWKMRIYLSSSIIITHTHTHIHTHTHTQIVSPQTLQLVMVQFC